MAKRTIDPRLGQRLQELRKHRNISQRRIAKALGISIGTVQGYERGRIRISADRLTDLARALQCEPTELLAPPGALLPQYKIRTSLVRTTTIEPVRLGFYSRSADTTVAVETDAQTKAACGLPADAPNELAWQCWYNRIHTDDHARVNAELARLNNPRDGIFNMQYRLLGVDGIERCIIDYGRMVFDSAGEPVHLRGLMLDITDEPRNKKTDDRIRRILAAVRPGLIAFLTAATAACLTLDGFVPALNGPPQLVFDLEHLVDDSDRIDADDLA